MNTITIGSSVQPDAIRQNFDTIAAALNEIAVGRFRLSIDNIDWPNGDGGTWEIVGGSGLIVSGGILEASTNISIDTSVLPLRSGTLAQFAATTSAELAGVISDETGSGSLVFGTSPTLTTPTIADFTNAQHDHLDADDGGTLDAAAIASGTIAIARVPTGTTSTTVPFGNDARFTGYVDTQAGRCGPMLDLATANLQTTSGTAYFRYIGRATTAAVLEYIWVRGTTAGAGAQTAEVGLFYGSGPPNGASQTMTCIWANGTLDALTSVGATLKHGNTVANAVAHAAGQHLYLGYRCAMATTQPFVRAEVHDWRQGRHLITAGAAAFAAAGTYTGALLTNCEDPIPLMGWSFA
jgi:hypothetical protein